MMAWRVNKMHEGSVARRIEGHKTTEIIASQLLYSVESVKTNWPSDPPISYYQFKDDLGLKDRV
jgi:hypothetical protein